MSQPLLDVSQTDTAGVKKGWHSYGAGNPNLIKIQTFQKKHRNAFESEDFREMTARLEYLKEIRGIGVFTASLGMGKTFALQRFSKKMNPNLSSAPICACQP